METISEQDVKRMVLPDLRMALRARGLTPAGGLDTLRARLIEYLQAVEQGLVPSAAPAEGHGGAPAYFDAQHEAARQATNNYARADGQNLGNFMTDRNSSRVLAPPGGASSIIFGSSDEPASHTRFATPEAPSYAQQGGAAAAMYGGAPAAYVARPPPAAASGGFGDSRGPTTNNYVRADGQNLGNFMTDRNSSRVLAPPGGASSIRFGA